MVATAERPTTQEGVHIPGLDIVLPPELDLTKDSGREVVIDVVRKLTEKYTAAYKGFLGVFLVGSVAHNESHNDSDIDLVYVLKQPRGKMDSAILDEGLVDFFTDVDEILGCYGLSSDHSFVIDYLEVQREHRSPTRPPEEYPGAFQLDKDSLFFSSDPTVEAALQQMLKFKTEEPFLFFPSEGPQPSYEVALKNRKLMCFLTPKKLDEEKAKSLAISLAVNYIEPVIAKLTGSPSPAA